MAILNQHGVRYLISKIFSALQDVKKSFPDPMVEITYSNLKQLRDSKKLTPGRQYRITDYVTTTTQVNTQSAGHQFDIIVTADDVNVLNEKARAIKHYSLLINVGDSVYVYGKPSGELSKLIYEESGKTKTIDGVTYREFRKISGHGNAISGILIKEDDYISGVTVGTKYYISNKDGSIGVTDDILEICSEHFSNSNLDAWEIWYCLDNDMDRFAWADEQNGKGVIYRMIDEFGNDCPYDFKNIQFLRKMATTSNVALSGNEKINDYIFCPSNGTSEYSNPTYISEDSSVEGIYFYTFNGSSHTAEDMSLYGDTTLNTMKRYKYANNGKLMLNNIVFRHSGRLQTQKFDMDCFNMTFIIPSNDEVWDNYFGQYCRANIIISDEFFQNDFNRNFLRNICVNDGLCGNISNGYMQGNIIAGSFYNNNIDIYFTSNTIRNSFNHNKIDFEFNTNTIKNSFLQNNIGGLFENNRIEMYGDDSYFAFNNIGQQFQDNKIYYKFENNDIEPGMIGNTLNGSFRNNIIGSAFANNIIMGDDLDGIGVNQTVFGVYSQNNTFTRILNCKFDALCQENRISYMTACNIGIAFRFNTFSYNTEFEDRPYIQGCTFGNYVWYNNFFNASTASANNPIKNLIVQNNLQGAEDNINQINVTVNSQQIILVGYKLNGTIGQKVVYAI